MTAGHVLRRIGLAAALFSVTMSPFAAIAQDGPPALLPSSPWEVGTNPDSCSIARGFADEATLLTFRSVPTKGRLELTIASKNWPRRKVARIPAKIVARDSNSKLDRIAWLDRLNQGKVGIADISSVDELFVRRMAEGAELAIYVEKEDPIIFKLTDLAPAFRALHKCNDALMRSWGIDPMPFYRLQSPPKPAGQRWNWIDGDDYPEWAFAQSREGKAVFRFVVQTNGRIRDCKTVVSTGDVNLDNYSCRLIVKRAHYLPAIGEDGKAVEVQLIDAINWILSPG